MVKGLRTKAKCLALDQETECAHWSFGVGGNEGDDTTECMYKCHFTERRGS